MALIACSECGASIADKAELCPTCGAKTAYAVNEAKKATKLTLGLVGCGCWPLLAALGVMGIVLFMVLLGVH